MVLHHRIEHYQFGPATTHVRFVHFAAAINVQELFLDIEEVVRGGYEVGCRVTQTQGRCRSELLDVRSVKGSRIQVGGVVYQDVSGHFLGRCGLPGHVNSHSSLWSLRNLTVRPPSTHTGLNITLRVWTMSVSQTPELPST